MSTQYTTIIVGKPLAGGVTTITLNRPDKLNSFTPKMANELEAAFAQLSNDPSTRVIVFNGSGRIFCAGADLAAFAAGGEYPKGHKDEGGRVSLAIHNCKKPTIALLHGAAVGVGITMTLPCVMRIVVKGTKVAFPFVKRGLVMEACSSYILPRLLGWGPAQQVVVTGDTYKAGVDAVVDGLCNEVCATYEEAERRVAQVAQKMATENSGTAMLAIRKMMWSDAGMVEKHWIESELLRRVRGGGDVEEGAKSFLQGRAPVFGPAQDITTGVLEGGMSKL